MTNINHKKICNLKICPANSGNGLKATKIFIKSATKHVSKVSTEAKLLSFAREFLKRAILQSVYTRIKTHCVHRLVAEAFIPNPENKPEVDHIDTDRTNANVDNLRWVTSSENTQAALKNGNHKIGTESPLAKLTEAEVKDIRESYTPYDRLYGIRAMARNFNASIGTIAKIVNHITYKNVE